MLRPLHEANAHSGLAVAACMRSTGGPNKRGQDQEMERETRSACQQGPRRYHHCPKPPYVFEAGACLKTTSDPLPPPHLLLPSLRVCPRLGLFLNPPQDSSVCVLWVLAVQKHLNTLMCVSRALAAKNKPRTPYFCNPKHCTLTSCCICVLNVCVCACALADLIQ